ncbi:unnamed protein product [Prorocentrum cordatum]|uniref:Uncharacterized protein n=1 Tax=Prorocentrum cordatum TaxID=2364126 RepID=A0ABN9UG22_9DINO|nr:unnamed protein product [Polarella glacialis]
MDWRREGGLVSLPRRRLRCQTAPGHEARPRARPAAAALGPHAQAATCEPDSPESRKHRALRHGGVEEEEEEEEERGSGEGRQKGGATGRNGACLLKQQAREKPLAHCASPLYLQGGKTGLLCKNGFLKQQAREKPLAHCASPLKRHRGAALGGRPGRPGPGAEGRERILRCDART